MNSKHEIDELVVSSSSNPRRIIFLFHGYGVNKNNMLSLGENFNKLLGDVEVHIPNGIEQIDSPDSRKWFSFATENEKDWIEDFAKKSEKIVSYINAVINDKGLSYNDVVMIGFSQGAMISLELGLALGVKAIVSLSGRLLDLHKNRECKNTKVLFVHGDHDDVIPISYMFDSERILQNAGIKVDNAVMNGMGHYITRGVFDRVVDFLKEL